MTTIETGTQKLLKEIAGEFATLPEVTAVVFAGSRTGEFSDGSSDIDLCVYAEPEPPEAWRTQLALKYGTRPSIGNRFWETGDEWVASRNGTVFDIMYRSPAWIAEQLDRVWHRHQASVGYSTCFVYNVLHSQLFHDQDGWFASLQAKVAQPYPEPLRRAIVAKNHPVLRGLHSCYVHQITLALDRDDRVSVNHRVAALLASYFDILFAVNRFLHPGEKRLVDYVLEKCPKRPPGFQLLINELLSAIGTNDRSNILKRVNDLLDGLDALLIAEGLISHQVCDSVAEKR